jgi:hypothetical protein
MTQGGRSAQQKFGGCPALKERNNVRTFPSDVAIFRFSARERFAAAFALEPVGVQAHEIGSRVDEQAVWTRPSRLRDVVSRFAGQLTAL